MDMANRRLAELLKPHGFVRKRNCFYRKLDAGILQFIKFEYEHWLSRYELKIGLYSLYSALQPHWFTPSGCILRYSVAVLSSNANQAYSSPDAQLDTLHTHGLPWLDAMHTQRNLVDAMCNMEILENGEIIWVDSLKIAPFLISGDYLAADRVISSILQQHTGPDAWTVQPWLEADYKNFKECYPDEDLDLLQIHEWIRDGEHNIIDSYLQQNYINNTKNLKI